MKKIFQVVLVLPLLLSAHSLLAATNITIPGGSGVRPDCPILADGTVGLLE